MIARALQSEVWAAGGATRRAAGDRPLAGRQDRDGWAVGLRGAVAVLGRRLILAGLLGRVDVLHGGGPLARGGDQQLEVVRVRRRLERLVHLDAAVAVEVQERLVEG